MKSAGAVAPLLAVARLTEPAPVMTWSVQTTNVWVTVPALPSTTVGEVTWTPGTGNAVSSSSRIVPEPVVSTSVRPDGVERLREYCSEKPSSAVSPLTVTATVLTCWPAVQLMGLEVRAVKSAGAVAPLLAVARLTEPAPVMTWSVQTTNVWVTVPALPSTTVGEVTWTPGTGNAVSSSSRIVPEPVVSTSVRPDGVERLREYCSEKPSSAVSPLTVTATVLTCWPAVQLMGLEVRAVKSAGAVAPLLAVARLTEPAPVMTWSVQTTNVWGGIDHQIGCCKLVRHDRCNLFVEQKLFIGEIDSGKNAIFRENIIAEGNQTEKILLCNNFRELAIAGNEKPELCLKREGCPIAVKLFEKRILFRFFEHEPARHIPCHQRAQRGFASAYHPFDTEILYPWRQLYCRFIHTCTPYRCIIFIC